MTRRTSSRGPGRPPGADGAETRLRILHSARETFATTGFDRASLKQIAEDAGLTRNAIANYYTSKIGLYTAALASVQAVVVQQILQEAERTDGPVHARVMAVFEQATSFSRTDPTFVRFFVTSTADAIHHPDLREQALQPVDSVRSFVYGLIDDGRIGCEIDPSIDIEATTQVLMELIWGLAMDIGFYADVTEIPRTLRVIDRIVRSALAPAEPAARGYPSADAI